ncbi:MAG: trehalose-phosphatase [Maricaulaceae bacterium]
MTVNIKNMFSLPAGIALFLDFDGTLASFQDNPEKVYLDKRQINLLLRLNQHLDGALAIISGRDIQDLSKRVPRTLWRIGQHGLYVAPPSQEFCESVAGFSPELLQTITSITTEFKGVWVEHKGPILTIHHRANALAANDIITALTPLISTEDGLVLQAGYNILEIKPKDANKGLAIERQMNFETFKGRIPVMIGDDATDEDGFIATQKLGGFGVKIGVGKTAALYRLDQIDDLYTLLGTLI